MIDATEARRRLQALLEEESTLVLCTAGETPWGAPLFYVPGRDGVLHWLSSPRSRHSLELAVRPEVAVAIHGSTFRWEEIRGAQLEGVAGIVDEPAERARLLAAYRARFDLGPTFEEAIARSVLYRFVPTRARLLDNALGFPGKVEIVFGQPAGE